MVWRFALSIFAMMKTPSCSRHSNSASLVDTKLGFECSMDEETGPVSKHWLVPSTTNVMRVYVSRKYAKAVVGGRNDHTYGDEARIWDLTPK